MAMTWWTAGTDKIKGKRMMTLVVEPLLVRARETEEV
jgi:hypothetical protein